MKAVWCWLGRPESLSGANEYKFWYLLLSLYSYGVLFPEDQREVIISEDLQELFALRFYDEADHIGNKIFCVSPLKFQTVSKECEEIEIPKKLYDSSRWFAMTLQTEPWCYVDADILFLEEGKDRWKKLQNRVLEAADRGEEIIIPGGYRISDMSAESAWATQNNCYSGYMKDFTRVYPQGGTRLELTDDLKVSNHTQLMGGTSLAGYVVGSELLRECRLLTEIADFEKVITLQGFRESLASYFLSLICKVRNIQCYQEYETLQYKVNTGIIHSADWLQFLELEGITPSWEEDYCNAKLMHAVLKRVISESIHPTVDNYKKVFVEEHNRVQMSKRKKV